MARLGAITDNIKRYGGRIISGRSIGPIHRELEKANEERRAERLKREEEEACSWF